MRGESTLSAVGVDQKRGKIQNRVAGGNRLCYNDPNVYVHHIGDTTMKRQAKVAGRGELWESGTNMGSTKRKNGGISDLCQLPKFAKTPI